MAHEKGKGSVKPPKGQTGHNQPSKLSESIERRKARDSSSNQAQIKKAKVRRLKSLLVLFRLSLKVCFLLTPALSSP